MSATPPRPHVSTRMPKGAKRPKASRACLACRKLKARCEPARESPLDTSMDLNGSVPLYICHRCKTLCLECCYETAEGQVVAALPVLDGPSPPLRSESRSNKRPRELDHVPEPSPSSANPQAVVLSPGITPRALSKPLYRKVHLTGLQRSPPEYPERFLNVSATISRLIGRRSEMKPEAVEYLLDWFDVRQPPLSSERIAQLSSALCAGKRAAVLMENRDLLPAEPTEDLDYLRVALQPFENRLYTLYIGMYSHYAPMLSIPVSSTGSLRSCRTTAEIFKLLSAYLVALPHLEDYSDLVKCRKPLRRAVDALLRRSLLLPSRELDTIFALHCCATNILYPVDGFAVDSRPFVAEREEDDGLLQYALDLNPRAALVTAMNVAFELGFHQEAQALRYFRVSHQKAERLGHADSHAQHVFLRAIERAILCIGLQQARIALDLAEDRIEWTSLKHLEQPVPHIDPKHVLSALDPVPHFLTPRERSRCLWILKRAQLYEMTLKLIDLRPAPGAALDRKFAEKRSTGCKDAFDDWRNAFQEEMRAPSLAFRDNDPSGVALHRFFTRFTTMENLALHSLIGHGYYREIVKDFRKRSSEHYSPEGQIWKTAPSICCRRDDEPLFPAFLLNYSFSQNTSKFLGMASVICPTMPQLYDFVSWEPTTSTEIPAPSLLALPTLEAGLFASPVLLSSEVRLPVIETWAHAASHFNPFLLSLISSYVKTLSSMHVTVDLPGVLKMRFAAANATSDLLQGPFEMLMRDMAAGELSIDDPHLESVLGPTFSIASQFKQMGIKVNTVRKDAPDVLYAVMDSGAPNNKTESVANGTSGVPSAAAEESASEDEEGLDEKVERVVAQVFGRQGLKGDVRSRSAQNSTKDEGSPYSGGHVTSRAGSVESAIASPRSAYAHRSLPANIERTTAASGPFAFQPLSHEALHLPPPSSTLLTPNSSVAPVQMHPSIRSTPVATPSVFSSESAERSSGHQQQQRQDQLHPRSFQQQQPGITSHTNGSYDFANASYNSTLQPSDLADLQSDDAQARAEEWLSQEQATAMRNQWTSCPMQANGSAATIVSGPPYPPIQAHVDPSTSYVPDATGRTFGDLYAPSKVHEHDSHAVQAGLYQPYSASQEVSDFHVDGLGYGADAVRAPNVAPRPIEQQQSGEVYESPLYGHACQQSRHHRPLQQGSLQPDQFQPEPAQREELSDQHHDEVHFQDPSLPQPQLPQEHQHRYQHQQHQNQHQPHQLYPHQPEQQNQQHQQYQHYQHPPDQQDQQEYGMQQQYQHPGPHQPYQQGARSNDHLYHQPSEHLHGQPSSTQPSDYVSYMPILQASPQEQHYQPQQTQQPTPPLGDYRSSPNGMAESAPSTIWNA